MFAPGPFTARGGKRPIISAQDAEVERYLKTEFEGGGAVEVLRKAREAIVPAKPTQPKSVRFTQPSRELERTKPIRVPSQV